MAERRKIREKEDLRQRRSKRHLSEALVKLMEERPLREISVVDICERAMVHRTTFYAHFEDKNDLLQYVMNELVEKLAQVREETVRELGLREGLLAELRMALEFFGKHRQLVMWDHLQGDFRVWVKMEDTVAQAVEKLIREEGSLGFLNGEPHEAEVAGRFYAGAMLSLVRWWLEKDMPVTEEQLSRIVDRLMPEGA